MKSRKKKKKRNVAEAAAAVVEVVDMIYSTDQKKRRVGKAPWGFKAL